MAGVAGRSGTNKGQDKPFRDALRKRIAEAGDDPRRLDRIAVALLAKAESGDIMAIKEVADRLDGKPAQSHEHGGSEGGDIFVQHIIRKIIDPDDTDGSGIPPAA